MRIKTGNKREGLKEKFIYFSESTREELNACHEEYLETDFFGRWTTSEFDTFTAQTQGKGFIIRPQFELDLDGEDFKGKATVEIISQDTGNKYEIETEYLKYFHESAVRKTYKKIIEICNVIEK